MSNQRIGRAGLPASSLSKSHTKHAMLDSAGFRYISVATYLHLLVAATYSLEVLREKPHILLYNLSKHGIFTT